MSASAKRRAVNPLDGEGYVSTRALADYTGFTTEAWRKWVNEYGMETIRVGAPPRPGFKDRRQIQILKADARRIVEVRN